MIIQSAREEDLKAIAKCHREAFSSSFSSGLGMRFLIRSFQWYITNQDTCLLILKDMNGQIIGYAGGLLRHGKTLHGSSTSIVQYAFKEALIGLLFRPWLFFHPEMWTNYRFIFNNIRLKIFSNKKSLQPFISSQKPTRSLGLVVIGTSKDLRGTGVGSALLQAFERKGKEFNAEQLHLSVRKNNERAILAYKRNGWKLICENDAEIQMIKII